MVRSLLISGAVLEPLRTPGLLLFEPELGLYPIDDMERMENCWKF